MFQTIVTVSPYPADEDQHPATHPPPNNNTTHPLPPPTVDYDPKHPPIEEEPAQINSTCIPVPARDCTSDDASSGILSTSTPSRSKSRNVLSRLAGLMKRPKRRRIRKGSLEGTSNDSSLTSNSLYYDQSPANHQRPSLHCSITLSLESTSKVVTTQESVSPPATTLLPDETQLDQDPSPPPTPPPPPNNPVISPPPARTISSSCPPLSTRTKAPRSNELENIRKFEADRVMRFTAPPPDDSSDCSSVQDYILSDPESPIISPVPRHRHQQAPPPVLQKEAVRVPSSNSGVAHPTAPPLPGVVGRMLDSRGRCYRFANSCPGSNILSLTLFNDDDDEEVNRSLDRRAGQVRRYLSSTSTSSTSSMESLQESLPSLKNFTDDLTLSTSGSKSADIFRNHVKPINGVAFAGAKEKSRSTSDIFKSQNFSAPSSNFSKVRSPTKLTPPPPRRRIRAYDVNFMVILA
eukprot:sb/3464471/